jgi:hypothetical protein
MASIFTMRPLEEGGAIARAGFDFQDHVAAIFCLQMLRDSSIRALWCETHDDLLIDKVVGEQSAVEFIQVKSDAPDQLWSVALLCERDQQAAGSSILEKQIAHDRGDENSLFRLVTYRDINDDLSQLKRNHVLRDQAWLNNLIAVLNQRVNDYESPKHNGVEYWANHMQWDVPGSVEAIENRNLVSIDEYLTGEAHISLLTDHKRRIYADLLGLLRGLATARWADGAQQKRITREQIISWFTEQSSAFPAVIGNRETLELVTLERESMARCEGRWRVLGVPEDIARNLSNDSTVGTPSTEFLHSFEGSFVWLVGDFGAGKSLVAERLFQRQLTIFRNNGTAKIPVFLEGARLAGRNLREEAEKYAGKLGNPNGRGIYLLLDGIDQAGTEGAMDLLNQAHTLSRTWQNSTVIVTSIRLSEEAYNDAKVTLPALTEPESVNLVRRISANDVPSIHWLPHVFHADISKPLFAILLAMRLRHNQQVPTSIGELIDEVASRAIAPWRRNFANAGELLCRLAVSSTDRGGGPVPINGTGLPTHQLQPLLETRLLIQEGNSLVFTVTTLAHWFAAEALGLGFVTPQALVNDELRRERWRYPLSVFVGTRTFDQVSNVLEPLVRAHPAFAAVVIRDALHGWHRQTQMPEINAQQLANQMHRAILAWSEAIEPLANLVTPRNDNGVLLKLSAYVSQGYVTVLWRDNPALPDAQGIQGEADFNSHRGRVTSDIIRDQPAWVWQQMKGHIASELRRLVQSRQLPNEILLYEKIWITACRRTVRSPIVDLRIPIEEISNAPRRLRPFHSGEDEIFDAEIARYRQQGMQFLEAPYPQSDQNPTPPRYSNRFSTQRRLERIRAVYTTAMRAYLEFVQGWLPRFAPRLRHFAIMPARINGVFIPVAQPEHPFNDRLFVRFEPLAHGSQNAVAIEIGTEQQGNELIALTQERIAQAAALRPSCADWLGIFSGGYLMSDVYQDDPCTNIVYNWIESDLREVDWDH